MPTPATQTGMRWQYLGLLTLALSPTKREGSVHTHIFKHSYGHTCSCRGNGSQFVAMFAFSEEAEEVGSELGEASLPSHPVLLPVNPFAPQAPALLKWQHHVTMMLFPNTIFTCRESLF